MNEINESDKLLGATIIANRTLIVGGEQRVNDHYASLTDTIVLDWYIGDGERAEADDVVCKLVGEEVAVKAGEQNAMHMLNTLSAASDRNSDDLFTMVYKIY